jgi:multiple sugar transport system permease protein
MLASRLIPGVVFILPMYLFFHLLGLVNNYLGLMLAYMSGLLPFVIWLMAGYFADVPQELEDAARVDGCSRLQAFTRVILPISTPGVVTVGLLVAIASWNEYFTPLIMGGPETTPATVYITQFVGAEIVQWGTMAAATLILVVPALVLTLLAQRGLLRGLSAGAIKG